MPELTLACSPLRVSERCPICQRALDTHTGHQLCTAEELQPVCDDCGRRHAPSLAALVTLASTAERVGRMHRHNVFPPLSALLDLASAAEKYTCAVAVQPRKAG